MRVRLKYDNFRFPRQNENLKTQKEDYVSKS